MTQALKFPGITLLLSGALALAGCGDDGTAVTDAGMGSDLGTGTDNGTPPDMCDTGETHFYVMDVIKPGAPVGADANEVPGFNLDGIVSDASEPMGCGKADYSYMGTDGIDNQFGPLLNEIPLPDGNVEESLAAAIADGTLIILLKVENVDNFTNDGCVKASLLIGNLPMGVADPMVMANGRFTPGQTFDILGRFGTPAMGGAVLTFETTIENGVLSGDSADPVPLELPVGGETVTLSLERPTFALSLNENNITSGVLGGSFDRMKAIDALTVLAPDQASTIRALVNANVDLDPDDMMACQSLSIAFTYEGVTGVEGMLRTE